MNIYLYHKTLIMEQMKKKKIERILNQTNVIMFIILQIEFVV